MGGIGQGIFPLRTIDKKHIATGAINQLKGRNIRKTGVVDLLGDMGETERETVHGE